MYNEICSRISINRSFIRQGFWEFELINERKFFTYFLVSLRDFSFNQSFNCFFDYRLVTDNSKVIFNESLLALVNKIHDGIDKTC